MEDGLGDTCTKEERKGDKEVLILVVMEDGLGAAKNLVSNIKVRRKVLILVVMEDGLGGLTRSRHTRRRKVLILVVMEDGLGAYICNDMLP